jgi:hypothetical protein
MHFPEVFKVKASWGVRYSLWSRAGTKPRPRMRARKVAEGSLAASLLLFLCGGGGNSLDWKGVMEDKRNAEWGEVKERMFH